MKKVDLRWFKLKWKGTEFFLVKIFKSSPTYFLCQSPHRSQVPSSSSCCKKCNQIGGGRGVIRGEGALGACPCPPSSILFKSPPPSEFEEKTVGKKCKMRKNSQKCTCFSDFLHFHYGGGEERGGGAGFPKTCSGSKLQLTIIYIFLFYFIMYNHLLAPWILSYAI